MIAMALYMKCSAGHINLLQQLCAKTIVTSADQSIDLRQSIYKRAKEAIESQELLPYGQQRGGLCWFSFVDHSSKAFAPQFYMAHDGQQATSRNAEQIESIISRMIDAD